MTDAFRTEHDSMGDVLVPVGAKWAAHTQRAVQNFPISGMTMERSLIHALAMIKGACAIVNGRLRVIPREIANAVNGAAVEVAAGRWDEQFPVDVFQTGSGTSSNMNMNEVLATLASEGLNNRLRVHPNDHVNASQSSNDVFPSAIHLASSQEVVVELVPALQHLAAALRRKQRKFAKIVKAGRTHLMDATPVTLGQEFGGYATAIDLGVERIQACMPRLGQLPLGGTAVGTGLNAPKGFARAVIASLAEQTGLPLSEARDHFEAQGGRDALVEVSGVLRTVALSLNKIANDVRLMSSGPRCGLSELHVPDLQPGSSIMPGKVNPVVPEAVCQVVAQVIGNDSAVAFGGSAGVLELNVMMPVMARNLLESIRLLASVTRVLADKCVAGIEADADRCLRYALSSPAVAAALNPVIGYERAAEVVREALASGRTLRDVIVDRGLLGESDVDKVLDVMAMTRGGLLR